MTNVATTSPGAQFKAVNILAHAKDGKTTGSSRANDAAWTPAKGSASKADKKHERAYMGQYHARTQK